MFSTAYPDQMNLCRLCLVREHVNVPIFEPKHQLPAKINACLPISVTAEDNLPKKICLDCFYKLESFYQFYNITAQAEQQLHSWLNESVPGPTVVFVKQEPEQLEEPTRSIENEHSYCWYGSDLPSTSVAQSDEDYKMPQSRKSQGYDTMLKGVFFCEQLGKANWVCVECSKSFLTHKEVKAHYLAEHRELEYYSCDQCDEAFEKLKPFKEHRLTHGIQTNAPLFNCKQCEYKTSNKWKLKDHCDRVHSDIYRFDCDYCGKRFKVKEDIRVHMLTHDDFEEMCDLCGKMFPSHYLSSHRRRKHINTYDYRCPVCKRKFRTQDTLEKHIKDNHDPNNPFKCDECGQEFKVKRYMVRHQGEVHRKLPTGIAKTWLCTICGKSFSVNKAYKMHFLTHTNIKPYKCNVCDGTFSQRSSLMLHWRKKHPDALEAPPPLLLKSIFDNF